MKKLIPDFLIYLRLLFGLAIPVIAILLGPAGKTLIIILIITGFLADIFDGIIARGMNISTERLRKLDSVIDRVFWYNVLFTAFVLHHNYILANSTLLIVVLGQDLFVYMVSLIRFKKIPSPHNLLTKLWGILVAISLTEIIISGESVLFDTMIVVGMVSRIDSLMIYLLLPKWDHDIPTCYHAYLIRNGKEIKKHKLFNG